MSKTGIGVIGCGDRMRDVLKGLPGLRDEIEIVALCDTNPESIDAAKSAFNSRATVYENYRELVNDPTVNWVAVGSWNCFHKDHVIAALEAGKHVYCEKPLATTLDDCVAMYDAWKASASLFTIGFTLRYSPHYRAIKQMLDEGAVGKIISMEFNETLDFNHGGFIMAGWRSLVENAGTHLLEKCCHDIDIANWLTGSLASRVASFGGLNFFIPENACHVERLGRNEHGAQAYQTWGLTNPFTHEKDIVDNQVAIIEYANGTRATFHTNCHAGIPERRIYILGAEGAIRGEVRSGKLEMQRVGFDEKLQDRATGVSGDHGGGDTFLRQDLYESMTKGKTPATSIEDALKSAVTCFGIDKAMETGTVVDMAPLWKHCSALKQ